MNINEQIRQWAQLVNESEDHADLENYNEQISKHSKLRISQNEAYIYADIKNGYACTIADLMAASNIVQKHIRSRFGFMIEVSTGEKDNNTRWISDVKVSKNLLILYLTYDYHKGMGTSKILDKVPEDFWNNNGEMLKDVEMVTEDGHRVMTIFCNKDVVRLYIEDDGYFFDGNKNPRVKNGKVNEAEESPITMLFRTSPDIDDNAGKITFTSIDEMKNFIESVGGEYSEQIADGFTQGKLMPIKLRKPIQQLAIQQSKKS